MGWGGIELFPVGDFIEYAMPIAALFLLLQFLAAMHLLGYRFILRAGREQQPSFFTFYAVQVAGFLAAATLFFGAVLASNWVDAIGDAAVELVPVLTYVLGMQLATVRLMNLSQGAAAKSLPLNFLVGVGLLFGIYLDL